MTDTPDETAEWRRGMEAAAAIADAYADEHFMMVRDMLLTDDWLRPGPSYMTDQLDLSVPISGRDEMCIHGSTAHAAQDIAAAIRSAAIGGLWPALTSAPRKRVGRRKPK